MNVQGHVELLAKDPTPAELFLVAMELGAALPWLTDKELRMLELAFAKAKVPSDDTRSQGFRSAISAVVAGAIQQREYLKDRKDEGPLASGPTDISSK